MNEDIDKSRGLYDKFYVTRQVDPKRKHLHCRYFVLDLNHDICAIPALKAYAKVCRKEYPVLAQDLIELCGRLTEEFEGRKEELK